MNLYSFQSYQKILTTLLFIFKIIGAYNVRHIKKYNNSARQGGDTVAFSTYTGAKKSNSYFWQVDCYSALLSTFTPNT